MSATCRGLVAALSSGILGSAAGLAVAFAAGQAVAASQGAFGATSTGQVTITLTKQPVLQVTGNRDVILAGEGAWSDDQTICVAGHGLAGFRLRVLAAAPGHRARLDGHPVEALPLHAVRSETVSCSNGSTSVLSLAGEERGRASVMVLLVSPE